MSISIKAKTDYSSLFGSLSNNQNNGLNLADYASIKNGSYGKLMKAYYTKDSASSVDSTNDKQKKSDVLEQLVGGKKSSATNAKDTGVTLSKLESATSKLSNSAQKLSDAKSYEKEDKDALFESATSFVKSYNELLSASGMSDNKNVTSTTNSITTFSNAFKKSLSEIGITVGDDKKLSIDEKSFKKADVSQIKKLFEGNGSYGGMVKANADTINKTAQTEAKKLSGVYQASGNYSSASYYSSSYLGSI